MSTQANITVQALIDEYAEAGEDLEAYRGVVIDSNGIATYPASQGDRIDGVTEASAGSGEQVRVIRDGQVPISIATVGTMAYGSDLAVETDGQFAESATSDNVSAIALATPDSADDVIQARVSDLIQRVTS